MEIDWRLVAPLLAIAILAILVTGPGMWSDTFGHRWLEAIRRAGRRRDSEG